MQNFINDIQLGFLTFPFVALVIALPYALYQYRRFGAISFWKTFVVYTFAFYCLCACYLIALPLPADHNAIVASAQTPQLKPFNVLEVIRESTDFSLHDRTTWAATLKTPCVYEAIFNVMLTMPLGAYLCYLFRCRWWQALIIGFTTTLLFETSQLTGLFGIYAHPYRLFDVDDLMLNTAGAMLGFWLAIPLSWALPSMDEVNSNAELKGMARVTVSRRLVAFLVDCLVTLLVFAVLWIAFSPTDLEIAKALAFDPSRSEARSFTSHFILGLYADPVSALLVLALVGLIIFGIVPIITRGRTPGHALVGVRIVTPDGADAPWYSYCIRYGLLLLFAIVPFWLSFLAPTAIEGISKATLVNMLVVVYGLWFVVLVLRCIASAFGHQLVMLNEYISNTRLASSRAIRVQSFRNYRRE